MAEGLGRHLSSKKKALALQLLNYIIDTVKEDDVSDSDRESLPSDGESFHWGDSSSSEHEGIDDSEIECASGESSQPGPSRKRKRLEVENVTDEDFQETDVSEEDMENVSDIVNDPTAEWKQVSKKSEGVQMPTFYFQPPRTPGVNPRLSKDVTPLDCFLELFDKNVKDHLRDSINEYAAHKVETETPSKVKANWKPVTDHEIYKFLAVIIQMGIAPKPSLKDYWDRSDKGYSSWYLQMFNKDRFDTIFQTMLFCSKKTDSGEKETMEPFINMILEKFQDVYYPGEHLLLDEMVVGWPGKWNYRNCNPRRKPRKYQVKVFGLVDCDTGYICNLRLYYNNETAFKVDLKTENPQATKVFDDLLRPFGSGHHVYCDSYYTSTKLIQFLNSKNIYLTGNISLHKKSFPPELRLKLLKLNLSHLGAAWFYNTPDQVLCVAFQDQKLKAKLPSIVVSTNAKVGTVGVVNNRHKRCTTPIVVNEYNSRVNGCRRVNQNANHSFFNRRSRSSWKKLFFWVLEVTQFNALLIYQKTTDEQDMKNCSLLSFKKSLIQELEALSACLASREEKKRAKLAFGHSDNSFVERFTGSHLVSYLPRKDRRCAVCSTPQLAKRTNFICIGCSHRPHLHPKNCFEIYHTANSYCS